MARQRVTRRRTWRRLADRLGIDVAEIERVQTRGGTGHRFDVFVRDGRWWYVWPHELKQAGWWGNGEITLSPDKRPNLST